MTPPDPTPPPRASEEISKAMDEVSTLREHVDELEESLTRHQQQYVR